MSGADWAGRYDTPLGRVFSDEHKISLQLKVELAHLKALGEVGRIPKDAFETLQAAVDAGRVTVDRVREIESQTHHDVMAMVKALTEQSAEYGGFVHLGLTSQDVNDTVTALQLTQCKQELLRGLTGVRSQLARLAREHRSLACIARTHGQHGIPTTMGYRFANFLFEVTTAASFLERVNTKASKMSGAVGTFASLGPIGRRTQAIALAELGLEPADCSTQVVSRLFLADYMFSLAAVAASLERLAKEIRNLQRSEIGELCEGVTPGQVGSSTMPQKRNPHKSERLCGLARIVRAQTMPQMETIALEHERDLTNSSVERVVLSSSTVLTHFMVLEMEKILKTLGVDLEAVHKNLHAGGGTQLSERIMMVLSDKIGRQEAHELLREHTQRANRLPHLREDPRVAAALSEEEFALLLQPETYIGEAETLVDEILAKHAPQ